MDVVGVYRCLYHVMLCTIQKARLARLALFAARRVTEPTSWGVDLTLLGLE